jgi:hypothetical protein
MTARCAPEMRLRPLYFAECSHGRLGNEFQALDRDANSRAEIVRQIRVTGNVIKVLEIDEGAGSCRDVTDELAAEAAAHEPATLDESCQKLRNILAEHDHRRDLIKHGVFSW